MSTSLYINPQTWAFYSECRSSSKCEIRRGTVNTNAPLSVINDRIIDDSFQFGQESGERLSDLNCKTFLRVRDELEH